MKNLCHQKASLHRWLSSPTLIYPTLPYQVHNVGLHPSVVKEEGKLVDNETLENIARLVGKFLEQREPGLCVSNQQVSQPPAVGNM